MYETVWSHWDTNPFRAAASIAKQEHIAAIQQVLLESMTWDSIDPDDFMDGLLQEIAGRTSIVVQYGGYGEYGSVRYRATYDRE